MDSLPLVCVGQKGFDGEIQTQHNDNKFSGKIKLFKGKTLGIIIITMKSTAPRLGKELECVYVCFRPLLPNEAYLQHNNITKR